MRQKNYPALTAHIAEHTKLVHRVAELQEGLRKDDVLTIEVMTFLRDWLTTHIMKVDKQYEPFLK